MKRMEEEQACVDIMETKAALLVARLRFSELVLKSLPETCSSLGVAEDEGFAAFTAY